jgi:hypothetical protein
MPLKANPQDLIAPYLAAYQSANGKLDVFMEYSAGWYLIAKADSPGNKYRGKTIRAMTARLLTRATQRQPSFAPATEYSPVSSSDYVI